MPFKPKLAAVIFILLVAALIFMLFVADSRGQNVSVTIDHDDGGLSGWIASDFRRVIFQLGHFGRNDYYGQQDTSVSNTSSYAQFDLGFIIPVAADLCITPMIGFYTQMSSGHTDILNQITTEGYISQHTYVYGWNYVYTRLPAMAEAYYYGRNYVMYQFTDACKLGAYSEIQWDLTGESDLQLIINRIGMVVDFHDDIRFFIGKDIRKELWNSTYFRVTANIDF